MTQVGMSGGSSPRSLPPDHPCVRVFDKDGKIILEVPRGASHFVVPEGAVRAVVWPFLTAPHESNVERDPRGEATYSSREHFGGETWAEASNTDTEPNP